MSFATASRRRLVFLLVACLVAAAGRPRHEPGTGGQPDAAPVAIVIDGITGETLSGLGDLPPGAQPSIFVRAGHTFTVQVSFHDATGATVPFNTDTTLAITGTTNSGAAVADPGDGRRAQGQRHLLAADQHRRRGQPGGAHRRGRRQEALRGRSRGLLPAERNSREGPSLRRRVGCPDRSRRPGFQQGIGGDANCTSATRSAPVCAIVLLPRGAGADVLLSVGACDTSAGSTYAPCFVGANGTGGAIVQTLFAQPTTPYTTTSPATVVVKCDKTLCGTGAIRD